MTPKEKAGVLIEALPYIQEYIGQTLVVKYGGNAMIDPVLQQAVMDDLLLLQMVGVKVVLVHGGGPDINEMLLKNGIEPRFVKGLRYTDDETMDIVQMVLCGKVNKDLCAMLKGKGVGLSGLDGSLFLAKRHTDSAETDFGRVGDIELVHPEIVTTMLDQGYIPVISSVALDMDDEKSCNINADTAASKIAAALHAKKLILLTDVPGLMMDPKDPETLLKTVKVSSVPALVSQNVIKGGMIPKVECCVEAIRQGVESATIQDGRLEHSILMELLSNDGIGTMFC